MNKKQKIDLDQLKKGGMVKLNEKDMFSVWVRTVCCNMDAKKLQKVADLAEKYGRGYVLFTTRQLPIIPFVHIDDVTTVKEELEKVHLMLDRCGARVRNTDVCYDANICSYAVTNPISLGEKIDQFWKNDPGGRKIKTSIAGCSKQCTSPRVLSDIGFVGGEKGYDVYLGGRLGLKPNIGSMVAESISEEECVSLLKNYVALIREEKWKGKRGADVVNALGVPAVKEILNKNLGEKHSEKAFLCDTRQDNKIEDGKIILRIRATCGEVTSDQLRKIADIAENYGKGFVHFVLRGGPEIPGVDKSKIEEIRKKLAEVNLEILDQGVDNLQTCFGAYCTNGIMDTQALLKKLEKIIKKLGINDLDIKISASGCPNSCGISHLSDIGFLGVIYPIVNKKTCTGCEVCVKACKVDAISIQNKLAVIDYNKCVWCMDCINACPFDAIEKGKKGYSVLVGGRGGYSPNDQRGGETKLGKVIKEFVSEDEALEIAEEILKNGKYKS
ncbi:MAG: 4Fe-4S binding protein [Candidatus Saganbacteria bacterium]|nr:4Fe-4S binding protein [Candidatus Saganbacteria bacterium]